MLRFLGPFKKYVHSDGGGEEVLQKRAKTYKGREGLLRVYVSQYFFKGVFSHLNC